LYVEILLKVDIKSNTLTLLVRGSHIGLTPSLVVEK